MSGHSRVVLTLMVFSAAITVVLDMQLVPVMGPIGAAFALASGAACYTVGCLLAGRRVTRGPAWVRRPRETVVEA
jgi:O-antigen/teichoic acid export membrane protein